MQKVSIKDAIRKGSVIVNAPVAILIIGAMLIGLGFLKTQPLITLIIIAAGYLLSWLYWSFAITRWKLWASAHVVLLSTNLPWKRKRGLLLSAPS